MTNASVEAPPVCYHCGEDCPDETITHQEKHFCCRGCLTVYDILNDTGLATYYAVASAPGTSQKQSAAPNTWAFLDQPDLVASLLDFQDGGVSRVTFFVPAIHCSACIWLLEHLPQLDAGVLQASVHFLKKTVSITFGHEKLSLRAVAELLQSVGYSPRVSSATPDPKKRAKRDSLPLKIGVAGFCFGNVMLLSLPEYLAGGFGIDASYRTFFSYLSFILALPVLFYSATSYFTGAARGLRHGLLTLDVPIALGLITLFGRSSYEIISQTGTGYLDSLTGLVFFLLIGRWYQNKTYQALSYDRDYLSYFPMAVTRLEQQQEVITSLKDLRVGDRVLIRNQELIPADAILLRGEARIDYSFVTGELTPVVKESGDPLYAGGRQQGSSLTIELRQPVASSYLTELWNQDVFTQPATVRSRRLIDQVGRYFTAVILAISFATAAYWYVHNPSVLFNAVTSVLIVACPCALALAAPFTFGHALRVFGRHGLYLKNAETVEKLATVDHMVFDKTGTITQAQPSKVPWVGKPLTSGEGELVRALARPLTHPLSQAIYRSLPDQTLLPLRYFSEVPGQGVVAEVDGRAVRLGSADWVGAGADTDPSGTRVYVKLDEDVRGYFRFANHYRSGFEALMMQLRQRYPTQLLSGDNDRERSALIPYFDALHFRQSPMDKLGHLKELEDEGQRVLMIGDGLNDAGALKQSYVGIAVADDVHHFSPACDAILDAQRLASLDHFLRFAQSTRLILKGALVLSFLYNLVGLSFAVSGLLTPLIAAVLMPLSSVTVVGFIVLAVNLRSRRLAPLSPVG